MPLHNYNYKLNDTMSLRDRLMMSTSLSDIHPLGSKSFRQITTIANPVLLGMLLIACGGGGSSSTPAAPVQLALEITPTGGEAVASNGIGLLNENADGSTSPVQIGTINDNKNGNEQAYYALPEDSNTANDKFAITGETGAQVLRFTGTDAGDYEASTRPKYNLKIERYDSEEHYNTRNEEGAKQPQLVDYIVNLKDLETLPINVADDAPFAHEDGEGFLNEGVDGSTTPILLFTLGDGTGTYVLTNHNDRFLVNENNQILYRGAALDFENANDPKKFILNVERTDAGNTQTFDEYVINLGDVAPDIMGNEGATTTALSYLAMGNVGDGNYKMIFALPAQGDTLTIEFEHGGAGGLGVVAQYVDNTNPSPDTLTGFKIITRSTAFSDIGLALGDKDAVIFRDIDTPEKQANFQLWYDYVKSVEDIKGQGASPIVSNPIFSSVVTLTGTER